MRYVLQVGVIDPNPQSYWTSGSVGLFNIETDLTEPFNADEATRKAHSSLVEAGIVQESCTVVLLSHREA
jgi:hypothetical protein